MAGNDPTAQQRRDSKTAQSSKDESTDAAGNSIESIHLAPVGATESDRQERIAKAAYSKAEKRGFAPGSDWDDWLDAEREIDNEPSPGHSER